MFLVPRGGPSKTIKIEVLSQKDEMVSSFGREGGRSTTGCEGGGGVCKRKTVIEPVSVVLLDLLYNKERRKTMVSLTIPSYWSFPTPSGSCFLDDLP